MSGDSGLAASSALDLVVGQNTPTARSRLRAAASDRRAAPGWPAAHTVPAGVLPAEELLPRRYFLAQLHREKRRVDRSKAALSLVIYRMAQRSSAEDTGALAALLLGSKRETDIAGRLGDDVLAVICPDTGGEGAQRFMAKIDSHSEGLRYSVECATYPDQLFEGLSDSPHVAHGPSPLLAEGRRRDLARDIYWFKRPLDIVGALVTLVLFAPVMVAAALAVKLSSRGPVIFRQTRLGKSGVPFVFYKFRSMRVDNDDRIHREFVKSLIVGDNAIADQSNDDAPFYAIKADPRVTSVGRFIRKTSIDELPQFWNVLKGDMSLVGPRPPLPYEAETYQSWHLRRVLDIKPGMTGLWQVEGRSKVPFAEMVRMDLRYIRGCSLALDLRILAKTFMVVLTCEGAD